MSRKCVNPLLSQFCPVVVHLGWLFKVHGLPANLISILDNFLLSSLASQVRKGQLGLDP